MEIDWTLGGLLPAPLLLLLGGVALWWGGDRLVECAAAVARALRVPDHVIGAVVLGFGTSFPELLVCVNAAVHDAPGVATGNVVGSNIANVGLILGIAAVLSPVLVGRKLRVVDVPLGLASGVGLWLFLRPEGGEVDRVVAAVLLAVFAAYIVLSLRTARGARDEESPDVPPEDRGLRRDAGWLLLGLIVVAIGADVFVLGAKGTASLLGVPDEIIGLSLVALGTSLPELVTTVAAARRGHPELAVGNVAGSNLFNLLFVLGTTGLVHPVPVTAEMTTSLLIMCGFAVLAYPFLSRQRHRMGRTQGTVLLALYAAYITWLFLQGRTPA